MNILVVNLLRLMALLFNVRPSLNRYLKGVDGWINFSIGFKTDTGSVNRALEFKDGKVRALKKIPDNVDVILRFINNKNLIEMLGTTPNEMFNLILNNKMIFDGNIVYLQAFNFYISLLMGKKHQKMLEKIHKKDVKERKKKYSIEKKDIPKELAERKNFRMKVENVDRNVKYLNDPYLSEYCIEDFPRLQFFLDRHFNQMPEVCVERPQILTQWYRENGFENDNEGNPWFSELRQAEVFKHLMSKKKPVIPERELVAGTTTSKEPTGVVFYPDAQGAMFWGELKSIENRLLNPYKITDEEAEILHNEVFPFWAKRNFREWVRDKYDKPLCLQIDERWVYYFVWKSVGISHTVPDYPKILKVGTLGIIKEITNKIEKLSKSDSEKINSLKSMKLTLEGINIYSDNLSKEAGRLADLEKDPERKIELKKIESICKKVPHNPAETLDEAVNVLWIIWVGIHMENTNTGLSLGRLDQWLQPCFENDMAKLKTEEEKSFYLKHAIEIVGCFFMRGTDHLPLVPDIGNYLFGGSSSDQAITLGGVTPDGEDGVCDMTYIMLKVTEMLSIRDPNVNARFNLEKNSDTYLKRLCEVNYITAATPSMHNDSAVFDSLDGNGYSIEDIRDWSATGCVEPTLSGKHMGHTGSILMNMVAALEMALNNGHHTPVSYTHLTLPTKRIV